MWMFTFEFFTILYKIFVVRHVFQMDDSLHVILKWLGIYDINFFFLPNIKFLDSTFQTKQTKKLVSYFIILLFSIHWICLLILKLLHIDFNTIYLYKNQECFTKMSDYLKIISLLNWRIHTHKYCRYCYFNKSKCYTSYRNRQFSNGFITEHLL